MLDEDIANSGALFGRHNVQNRVEEFRVVDEMCWRAREGERSEHFFNHVKALCFHSRHDGVGHDVEGGIQDRARLLQERDEGSVNRHTVHTRSLAYPSCRCRPENGRNCPPFQPRQRRVASHHAT